MGVSENRGYVPFLGGVPLRGFYSILGYKKGVPPLFWEIQMSEGGAPEMWLINPAVLLSLSWQLDPESFVGPPSPAPLTCFNPTLWAPQTTCQSNNGACPVKAAYFGALNP